MLILELSLNDSNILTNLKKKMKFIVIEHKHNQTINSRNYGTMTIIKAREIQPKNQ